MPVAPAPAVGANAPLNVAEFYRLVEAGAFGHARVELIDGRVIFKMGQKRLHYRAIRNVLRALQPLEAIGLFADSQGSVAVSENDAPEPDVFLTREDPTLSEREIVAADILLAVEVSVTTLREDRKEKSGLYAEAGIPEYWIVNPVARQVEVRRHPESGAYAEFVVYGEDEYVAPLVAPEHTIPVRSLMPPAGSASG